jgi:hypothetical protein
MVVLAGLVDWPVCAAQVDSARQLAQRRRVQVVVAAMAAMVGRAGQVAAGRADLRLAYFAADRAQLRFKTAR